MSDYQWLTPLSQQFLDNDYLEKGHTVDNRVDVVCNTAERLLKKKGYAKRLKDYFKLGWFSFSTPIWTNFGTDRGLPISCFGSYVGDSMSEILLAHNEVGMQTKYGGGTSAYFGDLRHRGATIKKNGTSSGPVHFMQMYDKLVNVVSQGSTRRGNLATYLGIDHPDIMEFLSIRGDGNPIQDLNFGVCVPDKWMRAMIDGDMDKRKVWARVLECRANIGYPFIFFVDNANAGRPDVYKDGDYRIKHTNLCTEIMLPDNEEWSFVCDLSSMNILYYDEWKHTDAIEVLTYLLDAVMTEFIEKAKKIYGFEKSVKFAEENRALGIGWLGYHSYLQSKMVPFESMEAQRLNIAIAKNIKKAAYAASAKLAEEYGEPKVLKGYGRRNTTLLAIAPTRSSAFILGQVSEGIEPEHANITIKDLAKGKFTIKNPYLERLLKEKGQDTPPIWKNILESGGSVQHLACLTDHEKAVFKTIAEISPKEIVLQAAQRQKYIDQGQSLNLFIHPSIPAKDVNALMIFGWENGIKSYYYQKSVNAAQEFARSILACSSCEG
jgi:ribonucleoside-diphosphate reductase alpha chain